MVTKNESKDEENNTKDNSDTSNDVDEMFNFLEKILFDQFGSKFLTQKSTNLSNGRITRVDIGSKSGNTSHDSVITTSDDDTSGRAFNAIGGEKCQILCFKDSCG